VEQVCGSGHVGNLHVAVLVLTLKLVLRGEDTWVLVAKMEITLDSARGVLGTLPIVSVGERHYQTGTLEPLRLARSDELVDDTLSVVGKVTKLGLPHNEGVGGAERVSVLESKTISLKVSIQM
jgi:hypothetical protein